MKKLLLLFFASVLLSNIAVAQQFQFGLGFAAGTKTGFSEDSNDGYGIGFGPQARFYVSPSEEFALVASFTYYIPKEFGPVKMNQTEFNFDLNLNISQTATTKYYAIVGVCVASIRAEAYGDSGTEGATGFRVGLGIKGENAFIEACFSPRKDYNDMLEQSNQVIASLGFYF